MIDVLVLLGMACFGIWILLRPAPKIPPDIEELLKKHPEVWRS